MGRPRGKGKKAIEAANNEDAGSGGEEEVIPTYKRRGRPQKPLKDDIDEEDDIVKMEEDGNETKPIVSAKDAKNLIENGGKKRRRQLKHSTDSGMEESGSGVRSGKDESARSNGYRQNGSRRKSTPRRAAEAGVECK